MSGRGRPRRRYAGLGAVAFLLLHALLAAAVVGVAAYRLRKIQEERSLPRLRAEPLALAPLYDDPEVVDDAQLARVLGRLRPRYAGAETSIANADHALRLVGRRGQLVDAEGAPVLGIRRLLTDHVTFQAVYGDETEPLLIDDGRGIEVRVGSGVAVSSHVDHTMASLAEVGTPRHFGLRTDRRWAEMADLVEGSLRAFELYQNEYEWSALTYALFLPPIDGWMTSEGQRIDFDSLAERIMRPPMPDGVCSGNHRLYTLTAFLQIDRQMRREGLEPLLEPESKGRIHAFLRGMSDALARHQHADGFWNFDWPYASPASAEPGETAGDRLGDRIIATGHALEWWALAPEDVLPPRAVRVAAGQWLVRTVDAMSDEEVQERFSFLSHAGRALALWRGLPSVEAAAGAGEG